MATLQTRTFHHTVKLRDIAGRLREVAATLPYKPIPAAYLKSDMAAAAARVVAQPAPRIEFHFGTLTVRCDAYAESVRAVAAKYERGTAALRNGMGLPARNLPGKASMRRPPDADAILAALADSTAEAA
jgi:hypothetical protein